MNFIEVYDNALTPEMCKEIMAFFDNDDRTARGWGGNIQIGYSLRNFMISLLIGTKWISDHDFMFLEDLGFEKRFEKSNLSISISFNTF